MAAALRHGRELAGATRPAMVDRLEDAGCPATTHQLRRWEDGIVPVPAYALVAAAKAAGRSVGELLVMAGVEDEAALIELVRQLRERLDKLERQHGMTRAAVDDLRSRQGLPVAERLQDTGQTSGE
jgi:hypothetical protein